MNYQMFITMQTAELKLSPVFFYFIFLCSFFLLRRTTDIFLRAENFITEHQQIKSLYLSSFLSVFCSVLFCYTVVVLVTDSDRFHKLSNISSFI